MSQLSDVLLKQDSKAAVIADCISLIDSEVQDKSGLSGFVIKAGYGAVKGIKPEFIHEAVSDLLPEFAAALGPIYDESQSKNVPVFDHFTANSSRVADALLQITDVKAERLKPGLVKGTYEKLRSTAKKSVEAAVPRLAKLVEKHTVQ